MVRFFRKNHKIIKNFILSKIFDLEGDPLDGVPEESMVSLWKKDATYTFQVTHAASNRVQVLISEPKSRRAASNRVQVLISEPKSRRVELSAGPDIGAEK